MDCRRGVRSVDSVYRELGDGRVGVCDDVDLLLELADFIAAGAVLEIVSRPGGRDAGDGFGGVDVQVVAVVIA